MRGNTNLDVSAAFKTLTHSIASGVTGNPLMYRVPFAGPNEPSVPMSVVGMDYLRADDAYDEGITWLWGSLFSEKGWQMAGDVVGLVYTDKLDFKSRLIAFDPSFLDPYPDGAVARTAKFKVAQKSWYLNRHAKALEVDADSLTNAQGQAIFMGKMKQLQFIVNDTVNMDCWELVVGAGCSQERSSQQDIAPTGPVSLSTVLFKSTEAWDIINKTARGLTNAFYNIRQQILRSNGSEPDRIIVTNKIKMRSTQTTQFQNYSTGGQKGVDQLIDGPDSLKTLGPDGAYIVTPNVNSYMLDDMDGLMQSINQKGSLDFFAPNVNEMGLFDAARNTIGVVYKRHAIERSNLWDATGEIRVFGDEMAKNAGDLTALPFHRGDSTDEHYGFHVQREKYTIRTDGASVIVGKRRIGELKTDDFGPAGFETLFAAFKSSMDAATREKASASYADIRRFGSLVNEGEFGSAIFQAYSHALRVSSENVESTPGPGVIGNMYGFKTVYGSDGLVPKIEYAKLSECIGEKWAGITDMLPKNVFAAGGPIATTQWVTAFEKFVKPLRLPVTDYAAIKTDFEALFAGNPDLTAGQGKTMLTKASIDVIFKDLLPGPACTGSYAGFKSVRAIPDANISKWGPMRKAAEEHLPTIETCSTLLAASFQSDQFDPRSAPFNINNPSSVDVHIADAVVPYVVPVYIRKNETTGNNPAVNAAVAGGLLADLVNVLFQVNLPEIAASVPEGYLKPAGGALDVADFNQLKTVTKFVEADLLLAGAVISEYLLTLHILRYGLRSALIKIKQPIPGPIDAGLYARFVETGDDSFDGMFKQLIAEFKGLSAPQKAARTFKDAERDVAERGVHSRFFTRTEWKQDPLPIVRVWTIANVPGVASTWQQNNGIVYGANVGGTAHTQGYLPTSLFMGADYVRTYASLKLQFPERVFDLVPGDVENPHMPMLVLTDNKMQIIRNLTNPDRRAKADDSKTLQGMIRDFPSTLRQYAPLLSRDHHLPGRRTAQNLMEDVDPEPFTHNEYVQAYRDTVSGPFHPDSLDAGLVAIIDTAGDLVVSPHLRYTLSWIYTTVHDAFTRAVMLAIAMGYTNMDATLNMYDTIKVVWFSPGVARLYVTIYCDRMVCCKGGVESAVYYLSNQQYRGGTDQKNAKAQLTLYLYTGSDIKKKENFGALSTARIDRIVSGMDTTWIDIRNNRNANQVLDALAEGDANEDANRNGSLIALAFPFTQDTSNRFYPIVAGGLAGTYIGQGGSVSADAMLGNFPMQPFYDALYNFSERRLRGSPRHKEALLINDNLQPSCIWDIDPHSKRPAEKHGESTFLGTLHPNWQSDRIE